MGLVTHVKPTPSLGALLIEAMWLLGGSQKSLGEKVGAARKTVGRWQAGRSSPGGSEVTEIARLLRPANLRLARAIVEAYNADLGPKLANLRLDVDAVAPREREELRNLDPFLVDAILYAACDAADAPPKTIRRALSAALGRARAMNVDLAALALALAPPEAKRATSKRETPSPPRPSRTAKGGASKAARA